jgi:hypothetical protein
MRHPAAAGTPGDLVKNADDNEPTAARAQAEVRATGPAGNRDDSSESPAEYSLVVQAGIR